MPPPQQQPAHPLVRPFILFVGLPVMLDVILHQWPRLMLDPSWFGKVFYCVAVVDHYVVFYPKLAAVLFIAALFSAHVLYKRWVLHRSDRFTRGATGLDDELKNLDFPAHEFDPAPYLFDPKRNGDTFVGLTPTRSWLPWETKFEPVYLSEEERSMHRHVLGKTGSGKTTSILWPQVLQDALDGKGILVVDAKGSDENAKMIRSIARAAGREADLRLFSLPAWNRPNLFSHTYNMVHVRPGTREDPGGDVAAMAERVFGVFDLGGGDSKYFETQQRNAFTRVCMLLHRMLDEKGRAMPFTLKDVGICLRGVASPKSSYAAALRYCLQYSLDRDAAAELMSQVETLGREAGSVLSGLLGAVDRFQSPIVNACQPDLVFEDALALNQIVYVQAPSNLYKLQAPALVKVMLMDLQQEASLRQLDRTRNQRAFSVVIDEFGSFADLSFVDSLNKLRDANIQFTISHQSMADLELVDEKFAQAVLDNTRTRDVLALDNPELCERMARSLGTRPRLEHTVQQGPDVLSTVTATGVLSTRAVEAYRLHPNRLKMLAARGQGFLFATRRGGTVAIPVVYAPMPRMQATWTEALRKIDQLKAKGLRLYERFVKEQLVPKLARAKRHERDDSDDDDVPSVG